jgi:glyoxylase-like metal-dependent hydrolase (beta-lactamase superfamily II)
MKNRGKKIMKIGENVYALDSTKGSYAYLIKDKETILIDTGRPGKVKNILNEIESLDINPKDIKHILLTHHDADRVGNAASLEKETRAILWAPKKDIPYILGDKSRPGVKKLGSLYLSLMRVKKPEKIRSYDNNKIDNIEIIPTPGHTPGHVSILYKDILFAGDLVRNSNGVLKIAPSIMNADEESIKESIRKISEYSFRWVCPDNGEPLELKEEWKQLLSDIEGK